MQKNKVTDIKESTRGQNRVNISIDGKFYCSLDIAQVVDLHLKVGRVLDEVEMQALKRASDFGKFYSRALEFTLSRPHSSREIREYLQKKTHSHKVSVFNRKTGEFEVVEREGYDKTLVEPVFQRLSERGYVDDARFAKLWVESRSLRKGISQKKLKIELIKKGISPEDIDRCFQEDNIRDERTEMRKIIERKSKKYPDRQKMIQYLLRQGFNYSDILDELSASSSEYSSE